MLNFFLIFFIFSCDSRGVNKALIPNHKDYGAIVNDVLDYYDYYKMTYIRESNGNTEGGYYVLAESTGGVPRDWDEKGVGAKSNSEAIGYGMIITALLGDKEIFDGLYKMFKAYPSENNPYLMSWIIPEPEDPSLSRSGSASDGDMDIAYSLYLAYKRWGSSGDINYIEESRRVVEAIENSLIGDNKAILLGDWAKDSDNIEYRSATRSSDWFPGHFQLFYNITGNSIWLEVLDTIYMDIIPNVANDETGLVPDFIKGDFTTRIGKFLESPYDGFYNWNACRYPWRQLVGYNHSSDKYKKYIGKELKKLSKFTKDEVGDDFNFTGIRPGYELTGLGFIDRQFTSSAFSSPLISTLSINKKYQEDLNMGWEYMKRRKESYFGDSITMLTMLNLSRLWFDPVNSEPHVVERADIAGLNLNDLEHRIIDKETFGTDTYNGEANFTVGDEIEVNVIDLGEFEYSIGIYNGPMALEFKNYYKIEFEVKSEVSRAFTSFIAMSSSPWSRYGGEYTTVEKGDEWSRVSYTFQMWDKSDSTANFGIQLGKMPSLYKSETGRIWFRNLKITEYILE